MVVDDFVMLDNVVQYMSVGYLYVIDVIDSVWFKVVLIVYCWCNKILLVIIGGVGGQIDLMQIQVIDLVKMIQDLLVVKLCECLKSDFGVVKNSKGKFGVDCVFFIEVLVYLQLDGMVCVMKVMVEGLKWMDCVFGFGVVMMVIVIFGFVVVFYVLKKMMVKVVCQG